MELFRERFIQLCTQLNGTVYKFYIVSATVVINNLLFNIAYIDIFNVFVLFVFINVGQLMVTNELCTVVIQRTPRFSI